MIFRYTPDMTPTFSIKFISTYEKRFIGQYRDCTYNPWVLTANYIMSCYIPLYDDVVFIKYKDRSHNEYVVVVDTNPSINVNDTILAFVNNHYLFFVEGVNEELFLKTKALIELTFNNKSDMNYTYVTKEVVYNNTLKQDFINNMDNYKTLFARFVLDKLILSNILRV